LLDDRFARIPPARPLRHALGEPLAAGPSEPLRPRLRVPLGRGLLPHGHPGGALPLRPRARAPLRPDARRVGRSLAGALVLRGLAGRAPRADGARAPPAAPDPALARPRPRLHLGPRARGAAAGG